MNRPLRLRVDAAAAAALVEARAAAVTAADLQERITELERRQLAARRQPWLSGRDPGTLSLSNSSTSTSAR